jgi:hypothetical protein
MEHPALLRVKRKRQDEAPEEICECVCVRVFSCAVRVCSVTLHQTLLTN